MNNSLIILACSGPGAWATIEKSISIGNYCAAMGSVVTLALAYDIWRSGRFRFTLPIAAFLLLIHPAWTISAVHGDCGFMKRDASYLVSAIYLILLVYQHFASCRSVASAAQNVPPLIDIPGQQSDCT